ncbi:hypothetical protein [Kitasatospora sp. NPDC085464]|uniref:hypothetical protein n=1 Tax=Kitasatospora sp. NPDC085464 TaxID=3364063 RepID=UPI0037C74E4E
MSNHEHGDTEAPQTGAETRERSAEQRTITAPTPPDVRDGDEGEDEAGDGDGDKAGEGDEDGDAPRPPAADTRAP